MFEVTLRHECVTESYAIMLSLTVSVGNFECIIYKPRLFDSAVAQFFGLTAWSCPRWVWAMPFGPCTHRLAVWH